ncbi:hypothetical protein [Anaerocolumna jejuensis]
MERSELIAYRRLLIANKSDTSVYNGLSGIAFGGFLGQSVHIG